MNKKFYKISGLIVIFLGLMGLMPITNASENNIVSNQKILVVTTFSILEDMVLEVGGDRVQVVSLIARKADAHTFEPSPRTVKKVSDAKLLISNGIGFETWLERLLQSSNFDGVHTVASTGVEALSFNEDAHNHEHEHEHDNHGGHNHNHQGLDPHAWQSLKNGIIYVENITDALIQIDQKNAQYYTERAEAYIQKMHDLITFIEAEIGGINPEDRNAVTAHDAFAYFAQAYDVNFMSAAGISTQAEPSAKDIAQLIDTSSNLGKVAFFVEFGTNPRMIKQLAKEIDMPVGGQLYSDTLDDVNHKAGTYLGMMHWNAEQLVNALK